MPTPSLPTSPAPPPSQAKTQKHTTAVELGRIKVTATATTATPEERRQRRGKPSLTVSTTLCLGALPPQTTITTATELCEASKQGEVFLAKAGSCEIGFETRVDGVPVSAAGAGFGIAMDGVDDGVGVGLLVGECAVWGDIGVVLKARHGDGDETELGGGKVPFFLHHRELATEMIKVVGGRVPVVEFVGMDVVLDFCSGRRTGKGKKRKVKGVGRGKKVPVAVEKPESFVQKGHGYGLRREPKPTTKIREVWRDAAMEEEDGSDEKAPPRYAWSRSEMATLLDVGLRKLLGVGKGPQGFRTSRSRPSPSLMDIAPAVWNLRYLQSLETHARAIPEIASGIARLANARSSLLREKVARLGFSGGPESNSIDHLSSPKRVEEEIRGRLWSLCQTKTQADPMAKTSTARAAAAKEETAYEAGHLPLARQENVIDDIGGTQEYSDDHDGQLVPFEASSNAPRHLLGEFSGGVDSEVIYNPQIPPDMFCDFFGRVLGGDEMDALIDDPPWTTLSTGHGRSWAEKGPNHRLLEDGGRNSSPIYYIGERDLMRGGGEHVDISQEEQVLVTDRDNPFSKSSAEAGFQDEDHQYHHTLGLLEDVIVDENMEEEDEAFIYTDGQGNCYTFEPHDAISHEAGFPENVFHIASVHQEPAEEEPPIWFHEC